MKRLRLVFVLLAALLWLPLLLLVGFALRTVEQEEAGRYKAVADRIFDEMERELTALPAPRRGAARGRLRLRERGRLVAAARAGREPFVLGYRRARRGGALRSTGWGRDAADLRRAARRPSLAAPRDRRSRHAAGAGPAEAGQGERAAELREAKSQSPGSTLELKRKGEPQAKSYDVLSALNRGVRVREESKKQA